jgi:hypothetical protein
VKVWYQTEDAGDNRTNRLYQFIQGRIPSGYQDEGVSHLRAVGNGVMRMLLCMHGGSMDDCIERMDEFTFELYECDGIDYAEIAARMARKRGKYIPKPMQLPPRQFNVFPRKGAA